MVRETVKLDQQKLTTLITSATPKVLKEYINIYPSHFRNIDLSLSQVIIHKIVTWGQHQTNVSVVKVQRMPTSRVQPEKNGMAYDGCYIVQIIVPCNTDFNVLRSL